MDEQDLIKGLIKGNEEAFCELYAYYKDRLVFFASRFVKSNGLVEDIIQDVFISIWQNHTQIDPSQAFSSYLFTSVRNRTFNLLRDISKEQMLKNGLMESAVDFSTDTEDSLSEQDLNSLLDNILNMLTPQQRRIFKMSREEMLSHKEIALKLGISIHTVQQHVSESLKVIRTYLSKYSDTYIDLVILLLLFKS